MNQYFKRQLADYVEYHRDPTNCVMHVFGIVILFLAAVLPLSLFSVDAFGARVSLGAILASPVLIYWLLLDIPLGIGTLCGAVILLSVASIFVDHASAVGVWSISAVLIVIGVGFQVVGHRVFERRQPSLMHNPTHLLLGPVFVVAKLYIALGFRRDLAAIIGVVPEHESHLPSGSADERRSEVLPHS